MDKGGYGGDGDRWACDDRLSGGDGGSSATHQATPPPPLRQLVSAIAISALISALNSALWWALRQLVSAGCSCGGGGASGGTSRDGCQGSLWGNGCRGTLWGNGCRGTLWGNGCRGTSPPPLVAAGGLSGSWLGRHAAVARVYASLWAFFSMRRSSLLRVRLSALISALRRLEGL